MGEPSISDILNRIPKLTYDPKKRKLEEYESPEAKQERADTSGDITASSSLADQAYDRLTELIELGEEAQQAIDDVCKHLEYPVDPDENPDVFGALSRLFGDDFSGMMTWKMYRQLLQLKYMIGDDFAKGELGLNGD